ncbi:endonuclease III [Actinomadura pelletieri DSM 43383]|uniref:Endonuclease III n=1 Tax=Actinomadura pelletieri DSM 43383 TaxID=1120940 RepID=A0A495QAF1_9ACTN|nr:endonuclease [Actinomadura pelletieri]RKS68670.1 endonuclease III [Actinomadura pelletieri DSM 43383]
MDTVVKKLLHESGETFAEQAGIPLKDQPAALFKLLVLANLLSARISSDIAVAAARELFEAGGGTPRGMSRLTWQERVDALGRGHYVRYDESTASRLGDTARIVQDKYKGDLRRLAIDAGRDPRKAAELLQEFPGIGPTGVDIFCREAQSIWPWLRPYVDGQVKKGAERLGLPTDARELASTVPDKDLARLTAALVRVARDKKLADTLKAA